MKNLSDEKKCIILLALTILMGILLFYTYIGDSQNDYDGIIRLHVIANSNTVGDQALKLKVRDAVIAYMNDQTNPGTVDETREHLKDNLGRLEAIADGVIAAEGYNYTAKADIGIRYIPEKSYGNITFPAGNYEALNITLGEGDGENWWCVLFPPLCLLDEGTASANAAAGSGGSDSMTEIINEVSGEVLSESDFSNLSDEEFAEKFADELAKRLSVELTGELADELAKGLAGETAGGKTSEKISDSDESYAALTESQRLQLRWKLIELLQKNDQTS